MKQTALLVIAALCAASAAAADAWADQPRPDTGVAVGIVHGDDNTLYVLVFSTEGSGTITAWNATAGMAPVEPNPFSLDDAAWGSDLGYAHFDLDGARHAAVAVVGGPPVIIQAIDAVPYVGENTGESWSFISIDANNERLAVQQRHGSDHYGFNITIYHFYGVGEPASEIREEFRAAWGKHQGRWNYTTTYFGAVEKFGVGWEGGPTMAVVSIDRMSYAAVNTVEGPPVLVDALEAATLGLGDITDITPADYLRWDHPPRLLATPVDASAEVAVLAGSDGNTYAVVFAGNTFNIHNITDPRNPLEVDSLSMQTTRLAKGTGIMHVTLTHPVRGGYDVPDRFDLGGAAARVGPEGTWAVVATPDGGIVLAETHPNTAVAVLRDGGRVLAVERDGGWEEVYTGRGGATFGDPGVRAYDLADPASPVPVDPETLPPIQDGSFGAPGRAVTTEINGTAWVLVPVREEPAGGPVMEITHLRSSVTGSGDLSVLFKVRNVHHETLTISVDRLKIGSLVMEQHHTYSGFGAPEHGSVRMSGPTTWGSVGMTEAYGLTRDPGHPAVYAVYSVPDLGVVYAFVQSDSHVIVAPGETGKVLVTIRDPCRDGIEHVFPVDGGCGPWDYNLDTDRLAGSRDGTIYRKAAATELTLVAEGYPEWTAAAGTD